jgi:hypothetical protein
MQTITAERVTVRWEAKKKMWAISIQVGEEVIRRFEALPRDAGDRGLRLLAVMTVRDEGYEIEPERVCIERQEP